MQLCSVCLMAVSMHILQAWVLSCVLAWLRSVAHMGSSKKAPKALRRRGQKGKDRKKQRRSSSSSSDTEDSTYAEVKAVAETFGLRLASPYCFSTLCICLAVP